eukprot:3519254-Amphidinium_carterae.1
MFAARFRSSTSYPKDRSTTARQADGTRERQLIPPSQRDLCEYRSMSKTRSTLLRERTICRYTIPWSNTTKTLLGHTVDRVPRVSSGRSDNPKFTAKAIFVHVRTVS